MFAEIPVNYKPNNCNYKASQLTIDRLTNIINAVVMPVQVVKNGNKYKVQQVVYSNGKRERKTLESFSTIKDAKKFAKTLPTSTINNQLATRTFKEAFDFSLSIIENKIKNKIIEESSGNAYRQKIIYHVIPNIEKIGKVNLNEFTMDDFLNSFLINLNNSKTIGPKGRTEKFISHKTYKESIFLFKSCIKDWIAAEFDTGRLQSVLAYKIPRTFKCKGHSKPSEFFVTYNDALKIIKNTNNIKNKLLLSLALVTAARLNEVLAVCVEDVDVKLNTIWIRHTLGMDNEFRENKTKTFDRVISVTKELIDLIVIYKSTHPNLKKECQGKLTRLFNFTKNNASKIAQREAEKAGVLWEGGLAPYRKLGSTMIYNAGVLNEKEFCTRHGWSDLPVFFKNYIRNTRTFEQQPRLESVFVHNNNVCVS